MSIPTSAIAATAVGLVSSPGLDPAENTLNLPRPRWRSHPAAIWERPALCTQRKSTEGECFILISLIRCGRQDSGDPGFGWRSHV